MSAGRIACSSPVDRLLELTYQAEQSHFWFRGFRQYMRLSLARATAGVSSPRILDCGCGTGSNLEMLRPFGDAFGFDLSAVGTVFAKAHGHRVARANMAVMPFKDATFDLVTSFDVFQVIPDVIEQAAILEMQRVLKPGGRLLLHVAALEILHGKHSVLSEEKRRYTPASLRSLVESAGFRIERMTFDHLEVGVFFAHARIVELGRILRVSAEEDERFVELGRFCVARDPVGASDAVRL